MMDCQKTCYLEKSLEEEEEEDQGQDCRTM